MAAENTQPPAEQNGLLERVGEVAHDVVDAVAETVTETVNDTAETVKDVIEDVTGADGNDDSDAPKK